MQDVGNVLVPLEDTEATDRALDEVGLLAGSEEISNVTLLETLGPVPPGLLESGGATDRVEERRQHAELAAARKEWFEEARRKEEPRVRRAEQRLVDAGVARERVHRDYVMLIPEDDVARVVLDRAEAQRCTRIVVGRPHVPWWRALFTRRLDEQLAAKAPPGVDVVAVHGNG